MASPLVMKLRHGGALLDEDKAVLEGLTMQRARRLRAGTDLISEGDCPQGVCLVVMGIACRYKVVDGGRRQIMALLLPGDLCDLHGSILGEMDHSIGTVTGCTVVDISPAVVSELLDNPRIARALWWSTLVDEAILREWIVSMGRRTAGAQLAHLFCELMVRFQTVGLAEPDGYKLPFTQVELSDVLGISAVHVNRSLHALRDEALIKLTRGKLTILNPAGLERRASFRANYLHLGQPVAEKLPNGS